jgi:hypothetical protein
MKGGAMQKVIATNEEERFTSEELKKMDDIMIHFRSLIRAGEVISEAALKDSFKEYTRFS